MSDLEKIEYDSTVAWAPLTDEKGRKNWVVIARKGGKNTMLILPCGDEPMRYVELENATAMVPA
jgi:hypothetical protein